MANWSAGLKTLGEGLGRMGVVKKQEEENHLEALRREAIEELRREHDTTMLGKKMEHDKELFDARTAADADRQKESEAGADRRSNAQIAAQDRRSVDSAIANVNANSSRQLIAISNARQKIQAARAEAGDMADPGSIAQWDAAMADLEDQAKVVNQSRIFEIRRIREGNWGKPMSQQDVDNLIGAKGENSEDVVAAAAAGAPAAAAPQAAPASVVTGAQQEEEDDLFPALPNDPAAGRVQRGGTMESAAGGFRELGQGAGNAAGSLLAPVKDGLRDLGNWAGDKREEARKRAGLE